MLDAGVAGGVAAGVPNGVPAGVVAAEKVGLNSFALGLNRKDFASGLRLDLDAGGRGGCPLLGCPPEASAASASATKSSYLNSPSCGAQD